MVFNDPASIDSSENLALLSESYAFFAGLPSLFGLAPAAATASLFSSLLKFNPKTELFEAETPKIPGLIGLLLVKGFPTGC